MKILFLGTSHGYPEKGRFTSATLIEAGAHSYLLDAGGPAAALMMNHEKKFSDLRGIFITHMHSDHVGALSGVIDSLLRFDNDKAICFFPEKDGMDAFFQWLAAMYTQMRRVHAMVRFSVTEPGRIFENEDVAVTAIPTRHLGSEKNQAYAYSFEQNGRSVLFTGDMSGGFPEYPEIISDRHYNLIVCEMAHTALKDAAEMLKKSHTDRMILTHYSAGKIEGYEEIFPTFPFDIQLASDGLELVL